MKDSYSDKQEATVKKGAPVDQAAYKSEGGKMAERRGCKLDSQGDVGKKEQSAYVKAGIEDQKKQAGA